MKRISIVDGETVPITYMAPKLNGPIGAERAFLCGKTGSGKSFLSKRLLNLYVSEEATAAYKGHLCIIDPNANFKFPSDKIVERPEEVSFSRGIKTLIYRPAPDVMRSKDWNDVFNRLFNSDVKRLMTYVDEIYALNSIFGKNSSGGDANWFKALLTRGRSVGRGAIMLAQRPRNIPLDIIGQAEHFVFFHMGVDDDRKLMSRLIGDVSDRGEEIAERGSLQQHQFWYVGPTMDQPRKMVANK